jgi:hypothetical protein
MDGARRSTRCASATRRCATLTRWLADPTFQSAYTQHSRRAFEDTLAGIRASTSEAVSVLRELLGSEQTPVLRLRAASELIGAGLRVADADVLARLDELERTLDFLRQASGKGETCAR